jgi:Histidine kinase-like ATPase domain
VLLICADAGHRQHTDEVIDAVVVLWRVRLRSPRRVARTTVVGTGTGWRPRRCRDGSTQPPIACAPTEVSWATCPGAMSTALVDNVRLVVSELASNVVRHARTPYQVALRAQSAIRIEVSDRSPAAPRRRDLDLGAATGRGLQIVELCAARWGYELVPGGKVVWAEVPFVVGGGDTSGRLHLPAATHPCSTNTEATQSISGVPGGFVANGLGSETPQASSDRQ